MINPILEKKGPPIDASLLQAQNELESFYMRRKDDSARKKVYRPQDMAKRTAHVGESATNLNREIASYRYLMARNNIREHETILSSKNYAHLTDALGYAKKSGLSDETIRAVLGKDGDARNNLLHALSDNEMKKVKKAPPTGMEKAVASKIPYRLAFYGAIGGYALSLASSRGRSSNADLYRPRER